MDGGPIPLADVEHTLLDVLRDELDKFSLDVIDLHLGVARA